MKNESRGERKNSEGFRKMGAIFYLYLCFYWGDVSIVYFYYIDGDFPMEVWTSGAVVVAGFTIYEIIKQGRKKSDLPEADERTIWNMSRFFAFLSHTYIAILFVSLGVFFMMGMESIPLLYVWLFMFYYIWVAGIGILIIKRL